MSALQHLQKYCAGPVPVLPYVASIKCGCSVVSVGARAAPHTHTKLELSNHPLSIYCNPSSGVFVSRVRTGRHLYRPRATMPRVLSVLSAIGTILAIFAAYLYPSLRTKAIVVGVTRPRDQIVNNHGDGLRHIPDTPYCEDLHLHEPSGLLFTACADPKSNLDARRHWFPPIGLLDADYAKQQKGSIVVIDPEVRRARSPPTVSAGEEAWLTHLPDVQSNSSGD